MKNVRQHLTNKVILIDLSVDMFTCIVPFLCVFLCVEAYEAIQWVDCVNLLYVCVCTAYHELESHQEMLT